MDNSKNQSTDIKNTSFSENFGFYGIFFFLFCFTLSIPMFYQRYYYVLSLEESLSFYPFFFTILGWIYAYSTLYLSNKYFMNYLERFLIPGLQRKGETLEDRKLRIGNVMGAFIYSITMTSILFKFAYGTELCPSFLGGTMRIDLWSFQSIHPMSEFCKFFYFFHFGKLVEKTFSQIANSRQSSSFWIVLFHHIIGDLMFFFLYFIYLTHWAFAIFFFFELCDVFLDATRLMREFKPTQGILTELSFGILYFLWFYNKIIGFHKEIFFNFLIILKRSIFVKNENSLLLILFLISILSLSILNIYWFYEMNIILYLKFYKKKDDFPFEEGQIVKKKK